MKQCPECKRFYPDETLNFCLDDGTALVDPGGPRDKDATALMPAGDVFGEAPTRVQNASGDTGPAKARGFDRRLITVPIVLAVLVAAGLLAYRFLGPVSGTQITTIAVLPFANASGNPDLEFLSDGMTESLISSLSRLPSLGVKARSSVFRYKGTSADVQSVGKELGVQAVLIGRVGQRGDVLTVYLELVDVATGDQLWGSPYNRKQSDLVALQSDITRDVADRLRLKLTTPEQQNLAKKYTENSEAYKLYLKGRYYWYKLPAKEFDKSRTYYQEAIAVDPNYALAYAGLAGYYGFGAAMGLLPPTDENWSRSEQAAVKALQLDPQLPSAYNAMAGVKQFSGDRAGAVADLDHALEIDPRYAEGHRHYSSLFLEEGKMEEAENRMRKALEIEPMSVPFNRGLAQIYFRGRKYDRAADQCGEALSLDPSDVPTLELLGDIYEQKGMQKEAIASWAKALSLGGDTELAAAVDRAFAASGFAAAVRVLWEKKLTALTEKSARGEFVPAAVFAMAYARLGDREQALRWVHRVTEERSGLFISVKLDPYFDALRHDPRFQADIQRINDSH